MGWGVEGDVHDIIRRTVFTSLTTRDGCYHNSDLRICYVHNPLTSHPYKVTTKIFFGGNRQQQACNRPQRSALDYKTRSSIPTVTATFIAGYYHTMI